MSEIAKTDLSEFTGTENYFQHWTGKLLYTDGVQHLAERAGAYWLIDVVASYQHELTGIEFQVWELKVNGSNGVVTMREDAGKPVKVRQKMEYTDFPFDEIQLWLVDEVLMLPSEY